jgi:predicted transcriptional regulator
MSQEFSDMIRSAINPSEERLATIAKETNIPLSALQEFMDGADLHLTSATKIAAYLGLELKPSVQQREDSISEESVKLTQQLDELTRAIPNVRLEELTLEQLQELQEAAAKIVEWTDKRINTEKDQ